MQNEKLTWEKPELIINELNLTESGVTFAGPEGVHSSGTTNWQPS